MAGPRLPNRSRDAERDAPGGYRVTLTPRPVASARR